MKPHTIVYRTLKDVDQYLGYTAEEEARHTNRPVEELREERQECSRLPLEEAKRLLDQKKEELSAVTTAEAAEFYEMPQDTVLKYLRNGWLHGFKRNHGRWGVWISRKHKGFPKWNTLQV